MQRAVSSNRPSEFIPIAADAFPMTVIQHGAGAALFNCGITAGVEYCRVHISALFQIILFRVILFVDSIAANGGKSASSQADT